MRQQGRGAFSGLCLRLVMHAATHARQGVALGMRLTRCNSGAAVASMFCVLASLWFK